MKKLKKIFVLTSLAAVLACSTLSIPSFANAATYDSVNISVNNSAIMEISPDGQNYESQSALSEEEIRSELDKMWKEAEKQGLKRPTIMPMSTVTGNAGTSTIYYTTPGSLFWELKPSFIGPYYYNLLITITNESTGRIEDTIPISGFSPVLGGPISAYVNVGYLPKGRYDAVLSGYVIYDPYEAVIEEPNAAFTIY